MCGDLQNSMDLGETVPCVCSETRLTLSVDGSEVSDMRVKVILRTQEEEDHLAVGLPAVKGANMLRMNIVMVVQACTVTSAC